MKTLHEKSSCCRGKIYRFGNRRRQCSLCGRTWTVWRRKRGRKPRHRDRNLLRKILLERQRFGQQIRKNNSLSIEGLRQRFRKALSWFVNQPGKENLPSGELILLADGFWFRFKKEDWVLYLMALKPIKQDKAVILGPVLLPGKESYESWSQVIETIPKEVKDRIKAFVSDNFRASKKLVRKYKWVHQLCHFHLIAQLQIRRGKRKPTISGRNIREEIYLTIREALETSSKQRLKSLKENLRILASLPDCPKKLAMITNEFLKELKRFRAYLIYPQLHLPTTTNALEVTGRIIRERSKSINTPKALLLWATAITRLRSTVTCNGNKNQQN